MNCNHFFRSSSHRGLLALVSVIIAAQRNACGQEALRISTAADQAETAAQNQSEGAAEGYYNLLLGPVAWRFSSGLGFSYNSNVRLSQSPESDFILSPGLNSQMHWPVTINNSLDVSLNLGYSEYLEHSEWSSFFINSGSGLTFDVFVGDWKINLHDQISITQSGYQNPGVGELGQNTQFLQNTTGLSATVNWENVIPTIGYDHADYFSLDSGTSIQTTSENFTGSLGVPLRNELTVGGEVGASLISYGSSLASSAYNGSGATQWYTGVFGNWQISDFLTVALHAGYNDYSADGALTGVSSGNESGIYFSGDLTHKVNQWFDYTLSAGRSTDLSSYGQVQTRTFVQINPGYSLFHNYTLSTPINFQTGTRPGYAVSGPAAYNQFTAGLNVSRLITKRLTASIGYQFVDETSQVVGLAYTLHVISLNLTYQF